MVVVLDGNGDGDGDGASQESQWRCVTHVWSFCFSFPAFSHVICTSVVCGHLGVEKNLHGSEFCIFFSQIKYIF